jgi:hypothetical protein
VAVNGWDIVLKKMQDPNTFNRAVKVAVQTVLTEQKNRIFLQGEAVEGKIGAYGTNPISISKKNQARNTGKTYFKGGYAEYKTDIGKNPGYVNLRNTDQMYFDYAFFDLGPGSYGIGFNNNVNFDKSQWMEAKYKKPIFNQNTKEGNILESVINFEIGKDLP